jgi:hypothetical protein
MDGNDTNYNPTLPNGEPREHFNDTGNQPLPITYDTQADGIYAHLVAAARERLNMRKQQEGK